MSRAADKRSEDQTGAQIRDHAWHFVAATFDAKTGTAILYHEPQIVYALDPEIPPVQKKIDAKIQHDDMPFVIAGYAAEQRQQSAGASVAFRKASLSEGTTTERSIVRAFAIARCRGSKSRR